MNKNFIPTVAIVGRTNVGKSTLFNALMGRRVSIVEDEHGVTRDRHYAFVKRFSFPFTIIDTGGILGEQSSELEEMVRAQAELAIEESNLVLCILDGIDGPHPHDKEVVSLLRRSEKPVLYVVNKCEKPQVMVSSSEFFSLGIDEMTQVSAAHGYGIGELVETIAAKLGIEVSEDEGDQEESKEEKEHEIKLAIIGKPNVGKSSIVNKILGEDRLVTSDIAGTTTDCIDIVLKRDGQLYKIVDTAGLRKKARVDDQSVERYANLHSLHALASSDVAVIVMDASLGSPSEQDAKIAGLAHERGRGVIFVMNKWDLVEKDHKSVKAYKDAIYATFKFATYAPILFVSAKSGKRCPSILDTAKKVYSNWSSRVQTSKLNKTLAVAFERRPPPVYRGAPIKMYFASQVEASPPHIVIFVNYPDRINFSYERYLKNCLRDSFGFEGTDIKVTFKKRTDSQNKAA